MKRLFDVLVASVLLVLLAPILLGVALAVGLALGSPVIFRHRRPGLHGELFTLFKFRTMTNASESSRRVLGDEQRLTKFGKFLRQTSLDELPELLNVVRGDMSLVGPRPLLREYLPLYNVEQQHRHDVRPGITGWAQINGRNASTWAQKFEHDIWYVNNYSFLLDLKILFATIKKVIAGENVSQPGHVTAPPFDGNG